MACFRGGGGQPMADAATGVRAVAGNDDRGYYLSGPDSERRQHAATMPSRWPCAGLFYGPSN